MIRAIPIALVVSLAGAGIAQADKPYRGDDHGGAHHGGKWCPPGLAKKQNGCMPPGQAKKVRIGDHYYDYDYERVRRHDDRYDFYRIGDIVVSADRKTGRILHLFDALGRELQ